MQTSSSHAAAEFEDVVQAQLASLDATDTYASAWADALEDVAAAAAASSQHGDGGLANSITNIRWGGRGRGGRGTSRRTFQPHDVIVDNVCLEFVNDASVSGPGGGGSRVLLDGATLKLLSGRVYSLVGR